MDKLRLVTSLAAFLVTFLAASLVAGSSSAFANPFPWCGVNILGHPVFQTYPSVTRFAPSTVTPGSNVVVSGQNFGFVTGKVVIHLINTSNPGFSSGADMKLPMTINFWSDTLIAGTIPAVSGVVAQTAVPLEIINQCGHSTVMQCPPDTPSCLPSQWTVGFGPTMDMQPVPAQDINCSMTSNNSGDVCMGEQSRLPFECPSLTGPATPLLLPGEPGVFLALHNSGWGNGNSGTDTYSVGNIGSWTVESVGDFDSQENNGSNHTWANLNYGGAGPTWKVQWSEDSCTSLGYAGMVTATGPLGVPF